MELQCIKWHRILFSKATNQQYQSSYWYSKTILYNGSNTFNTSITGLLPNTIYTCCVLAVISYGESEPVCQNNITTNVTSKYTEFYVWFLCPPYFTHV